MQRVRRETGAFIAVVGRQELPYVLDGSALRLLRGADEHASPTLKEPWGTVAFLVLLGNLVQYELDSARSYLNRY